MYNETDFESFNDTAGLQNITNSSMFWELFGPKYRLYIVGLLSSVSCIVPVIVLIRETSGNFFRWKVIDRFSMYTMVSDLMLYISHALYGVHTAFYARHFNRRISQLACSMHGLFNLESVLIQVCLSVATATIVACLVCRNRHLVLGRLDWRLSVPCCIPPLCVLVVAAGLEQIQQNKA